jgi:hypothetical protein
MHNVRIFKLICATFAAFLVALAAACCCADDYAYRIAIAEAEQAIKAAGMTPHADPAPPIATGPSEPVAKAATSRPSAPPVVIRAADHVAQSSTKVVITPARKPPSGPHWSHPGSTRAALINHLLSHSKHAGLHTRAQLEAMSYAELEAAHDRDHNAGRSAVKVQSSGSYCPNCSNPRRGLFGWRR